MAKQRKQKYLTNRRLESREFVDEFLRGQLSGGSKRISQMREAAQQWGISDRQLYDARDRLGVLSFRCLWRLPLPTKAAR